MLLCPAGKTRAFSLGKFCLNVHQHLKFLLRCRALLPRPMLRFSCKDSFQFFLAVPYPQSAEPDKSFLPCALDGGVLSAFDLIALLLQLLQKLLVVLGFFSQNVVDHAT